MSDKNLIAPDEESKTPERKRVKVYARPKVKTAQKDEKDTALAEEQVEKVAEEVAVEAKNAESQPAETETAENKAEVVIKDDKTENAKAETTEEVASEAPEEAAAEAATAEAANEEAAATDGAEKEESPYILEVESLKKYFVIKKNLLGKPLKSLKAVDNVSFKVKRGTTIGVVGESGCGKTTLGRTILRLYDVNGGKIVFDGVDITNLKRKEIRQYRTDMQLIFQDPYSSLPPRMTVGSIISEAVKVHKIVPREEVYDYVQGIMKQCGLQPQYYDRYPHEFSGGQRQRICIARALAVKPRLVICDEPVSALDVSIQAQIINLLKDLQEKMGLTYVFISHDLSVVKYITEQILVMYLGNVMELGKTDDIFKNPLHPYTKALFSAVPIPNPDVKMNRIILEGDIPSPANPPEGCKFHTRCSQCMDVCKFKQPEYIEAQPDHFVACHLYDEEVMAHLDEYSEEYKKLMEEREAAAKAAEEKRQKSVPYKVKAWFKSLPAKIKGLFKKKPVKPEEEGQNEENAEPDAKDEKPADGGAENPDERK